MNKTRPSVLQILLIVGFALTSFSLLLFLWVSFGGPVPFKAQAYRVEVPVPEATQLAVTGDVRISGVNVGKVVALRTGPDDRTIATIALNAKLVPLPRTTRAALRAKTLLGETYVELTPGRRGPNVPTLREGDRLPAAQVERTVELDEILSTLDADTRRAFQVWLQAQAVGVRGRGADISATLYDLPRTVETIDVLLAEMESQQAATRRAVGGTTTVFRALSARHGELRGLVADADRAFGALSAGREGAAGLFRALPGFERELTATLPALTRLAQRSTPIVQRLQPVASATGPAFSALRSMGPELRRLMERLGPLVTASGPATPALAAVLRDTPPLLDAFGPLTQQLRPVLRRLYDQRSDVTSLLGNVASASLARESDIQGNAGVNVNYLRIAQVLSPEALAFQQRPFGMSRRNPYVAPGGLRDLSRGLASLSGAACGNGDPAPPTAATPPELVDMLRAYAFRTDGRDVARPPCRVQDGPGFVPLRADPPVTAGGTR